MSITYSISVMARDFNVTTRTLRFYEAEGILRPARRGTTRLFSDADRERLEFALRGRRLGLSLEEIREIARLYEGDVRPDDARAALQRLSRIRGFRQQLIGRINDANAALQSMEALEARLLATMKGRTDDLDDGQLTLSLG